MKTISATKGEFVNLINGLFTVQELKGKKFSLAVSKNLTILKKELKPLESAGVPSEEFMVLAKQVNELANENSTDSKEKIEKLEADNKELVDARRIQMDEVTDLMSEETSIELQLMAENDLPEDITAKQINSLEKIIE